MDTSELINLVNQFRDERNWRQFHNEKDLALSISLEAAELLENFQWKTAQEGVEANLANIKEELADVLIYSLMLADNLGVSIEEIIQAKLALNRAKYPLEKAKDNKQKYTEY